MSVHTINETCSCGATFSIVTDYGGRAVDAAAVWRKDHRHPAGQPRIIRPRPALAGRSRG